MSCAQVILKPSSYAVRGKALFHKIVPWCQKDGELLLCELRCRPENGHSPVAGWELSAPTCGSASVPSWLGHEKQLSLHPLDPSCLQP